MLAGERLLIEVADRRFEGIANQERNGAQASVPVLEKIGKADRFRHRRTQTKVVLRLDPPMHNA
jgi:hypothetical protein